MPQTQRPLVAPCRNTSVCLQVKTHTHTHMQTVPQKLISSRAAFRDIMFTHSCSQTVEDAAGYSVVSPPSERKRVRNPVKTSLSELERRLSSTKVRKDPRVLHEFSYIFRGREQKRQEIPAGLKQEEERLKLGGSVKYPLGAFEPVRLLIRRSESQ